MFLPNSILRCIRALEDAGFCAYAVGGCVRDTLLGLTPKDYDLCTDALPSQIRSVFHSDKLGLAGERHGTVTVFTESGPVEITTFRADGHYSDGRHPDAVTFVRDIRQDLARRDFTVNAIAYSPTRGYADPFGGREDLQRKLLRTVGEPEGRFREDCLRILRGLRFAARFSLDIAPETYAAMVQLTPTLDGLSRERIFEELSGLLPYLTLPDFPRFAPMLTRAIPELAPLVGFDQRSPHHAYDLYTHTAHVTAAMPADLTLRWAALLHDIGKVPTYTQDATGRGHFYGHAPAGAEMADAVLARLHAPARLRETAVFLIANHMTRLQPDRLSLLRLMSRYGQDRVRSLLILQRADMASKGIPGESCEAHFQKVSGLLEAMSRETLCLGIRDLAVSGRDLKALGYQGRALGQALADLLDLVQSDTLPNDQEALLRFAADKSNLMG